MFVSCGCHVELVATDGQRLVGRDDVHVSGLDAHAVLDLLYRHRRGAFQHAGKMAFAVGRQVQHDDVGHSFCRRL